MDKKRIEEIALRIAKTIFNTESHRAWSYEGGDSEVKQFSHALIEAVQGEAVPANKVTETAPKEIFIQVSEDEDHCNEQFPPYPDENITWCHESVISCEVRYVRADIATAPPAVLPPAYIFDQASGSAALASAPDVPEGWKCPSCGTELKHEHAYGCIAAPAPEVK